MPDTAEDRREDELCYLERERNMIDVVGEAMKVINSRVCGFCGRKHNNIFCPDCGNRFVKCECCGKPVVFWMNERLCLKCSNEAAGR